MVRFWKGKNYVRQFLIEISELFPQIGNTKYSKVEILLEEFKSRFSDFAAQETNVKLFTNPSRFSEESISSLNINMQLEIVDFQSNFVLKGRFAEMPPVRPQ